MSKIVYIGAAGMTYEERGQWVHLGVTAITVAAYVVLVTGRADGMPVAEVDYQPIMLWTIGLGVAGSIVGRILVEIAGRVGDEINRQAEGLTSDVRDRDINRLGEYFGGIVLGGGMVVPFILALTEVDHFWIANSMYLAFALAAMVGASIKPVAYRRGF